MKAPVFILVLGLAVCCGEPLVTDSLLDPRHRDVPDMPHIVTEQTVAPSLPDSVITSMADTVVFFSAVEFSGNYDWRRDSVGGNYKAKLVLYRNMERLLALDCSEENCTHTAPDLHHIIYGHLYTEYSSGTSTIIKRDGDVIASFKGGEVLCGLLESGGAVHTLSKRKDGNGFSYRINSEVVLDGSGTPFGGFHDVSCKSTGALYKAGGQVCFCYLASETSAFCVRDGVARSVALPPRTRIVRDAKADADGVFTVSESTGGSWLKGQDVQTKLPGGIWEDARIVLENGHVGVSGTFTCSDGTLSSGVYWVPDSTVTVGPGNCVVICNGGGGIGVSHTERGGITLYENGRKTASPEGKYYFLSPRCAAVCGGRRYLLLTPLEEEGKCSLWMDGVEFPIKLTGYMTGMEAVVSPPS